MYAKRAAVDKEIANPVPIEVPVLSGPPSIAQLVQMYVRHEVNLAAQASGHGSFEDEDDFEDDEEVIDSPFVLEDDLPWDLNPEFGMEEDDGPFREEPAGEDPSEEKESQAPGVEQPARPSPDDSTST